MEALIAMAYGLIMLALGRALEFDEPDERYPLETNMDDTRLLELAGLASGESYGPNSNPLESNDLALRLAVKVRLCIDNNTGEENDREDVSVGNEIGRHDSVFVDEDHGTDPYAATRRAIVRAAAAIGASL